MRSIQQPLSELCCTGVLPRPVQGRSVISTGVTALSPSSRKRRGVRRVVQFLLIRFLRAHLRLAFLFLVGIQNNNSSLLSSSSLEKQDYKNHKGNEYDAASGGACRTSAQAMKMKMTKLTPSNDTNVHLGWGAVGRVCC